LQGERYPGPKKAEYFNGIARTIFFPILKRADRYTGLCLEAMHSISSSSNRAGRVCEVKRSQTLFTYPLEILHQYQREVASLHPVLLTPVTARAPNLQKTVHFYTLFSNTQYPGDSG
jgi:hypothetical protein